MRRHSRRKEQFGLLQAFGSAGDLTYTLLHPPVTMRMRLGLASDLRTLSFLSTLEFAAMITAVEKRAHQKPKPDWNHPFPPIKDALEEKCRGRVLQTDLDLQDDAPSGAKAREWREFRGRAKETPAVL